MISNLIKNYNRKEVIEEVSVGSYLEFKSTTPMTITPNYTNSGVTLQYSLNAKTWFNIPAKGVTPSASVIYFRGSATGTKSLYTGDVGGNAWLFTNANNLEVNGDITMLLQDSLGGMVRDIPLGNYAFTSMFYGCTSLTTAPELPSTTLAYNCYYNMFYNCSSLTTAPELPATNLAVSCYNSMFFGCTSLTIPPALPATNLAVNCYQSMFRGCTSLTTAPELPSTTLAGSCYNNMFYNCRSLTTAPALPATTLANYCYGSMFQGCTSLTTVPALPATTLANNCYSYMFQGCTSLTNVPALPATTLADYCYNAMFRGCTKIKLSATKTGAYVNEYRVPTVGTGTNANSDLNNMFSSTGGTFANTPTINTTYYIENQII